MNKQIDPLTGGSYDSEIKIYTDYHKLTIEEATLIMSKLTYKERDNAFNKIKGFFNDEEVLEIFQETDLEIKNIMVDRMLINKIYTIFVCDSLNYKFKY